MLKIMFNVTEDNVSYLLMTINENKNLIFSVTDDRIEIYYIEHDNEDPFPIYDYKYDGVNVGKAIDIFIEEIKKLK